MGTKFTESTCGGGGEGEEGKKKMTFERKTAGTGLTPDGSERREGGKTNRRK